MKSKMMIYYIDKETQKTVPVYIGNYDECFDFYLNNKAKYREEGIYLGLGGLDYAQRKE